jgi:hypothetical protein
VAKSPLERQLEEIERLRKRGTLTDEEYEARRSAILSDTSAPAPATKARGTGIMKWGMLGCLGIFAGVGLLVVIIIVAIAAAIGGAGDDASDPGGDVRVALAVGSSGEIAARGNGSKRSKVTILQIADNPPASGIMQPAAGKKFWGVEVEVENTGTQQVASLDWRLRDTTDVESNRTFFHDLGDDLDVAYHDLTPGGKVRGWVVFEIAADASPRWLRADPNPFLPYDLYFDAR